jgi:hypothetical protein
MKNSVHTWAFEFMPTRFLAAGRYPEYVGGDVVERTRLVIGGLGERVDASKYHYPREINEKKAEAIRPGSGASLRALHCLRFAY